MGKHARDKRPNLRPVTRVELSEQNIKLRWIAIALLLTVAVVSIGYGIYTALNVEPGWQEVEVSTREASCAGDFVFQYDFSQAGGSASAAYKQLTNIYTEAAVRAHKLFSSQVTEAGLKNLAWLNAHVNEPVTVEEELYEALSSLAWYGSRQPFLAPAVEEYNRVFLCENEEEAVRYAPTRDEEPRQWLAELGRYVSDPEMIRLELIGEDQVQLTVSQEYLDFAREHEIGILFDLGWMKNAFVVDYLASLLTESGFVHGYLASFDGFTRNLDDRGTSYSFNIFDRKEAGVNLPAVMTYNRPLAMVSLRSYPMSEQDRWHYYAFSDGEILSVMLDPETGLPQASAENLVCYGGFTCAEILLRAEKVFVAAEFDADALMAMADEGIYSVWFEDWKLCYNEEALSLLRNDAGGAEKYTFVKK